jgi:hypothetical protein
VRVRPRRAFAGPIGTHRAEVIGQGKWEDAKPMDDRQPKHRSLWALAILGASGLWAVQPASHWSAAIQISSVRIAFSFQSDTVRFRTFVSGNGHSLQPWDIES